MYSYRIEACRARLFRLAKKDLDSKTPSPTAEWRESCKRAIIPSVSTKTIHDSMYANYTINEKS